MSNKLRINQSIRTNLLMLEHVVSLVSSGAKVLDVGCGDGALLTMLVRERAVQARGLEISPIGVCACVAQGLSVVQGDANVDLEDYPDKSFDYVILTQTIQAMHRPRKILQQALRLGSYVIVSMPNFAHWRLRLSLLVNGRMPQSQSLPSPWYETDNIHLCTIKDFIDLCHDEKIIIEQSHAGRFGQAPISIHTKGFGLMIANLRDEEAIFLLRSGS